MEWIGSELKQQRTQYITHYIKICHSATNVHRKWKCSINIIPRCSFWATKPPSTNDVNTITMHHGKMQTRDAVRRNHHWTDVTKEYRRQIHKTHLSASLASGANSRTKALSSVVPELCISLALLFTVAEGAWDPALLGTSEWVDNAVLTSCRTIHPKDLATNR